MSNISGERVPFFRRKKAQASSIRARHLDEEENSKIDENNKNLNDNIESDNSSAESSDETDAAKIRLKLEEKRKIRRNRNKTNNKKARIDVSSSEDDTNEYSVKFDHDVKFSSRGLNPSLPNDMGATARTEVDTDYSKDAQSQFERVQKILKDKRLEMEKKIALEEEERKKYGERAKKPSYQEAGSSKESDNKPKIYEGMALYGAKEREDTVKGNASSGLNRMGPIRATQYMRASVRWDYAPDICKDYKETGYCTFGDSCKFMHDRTDYKHGWEIERDWEQGKLKESKEDEYLISTDESDSEQNKLPHSCHICRQTFKQPVVTKCKHYFCEVCALTNYQKSKKCAVCGEKTDGVFNVARDIIKKMNVSKSKEDNSEDQDIQEMDVKTLELAEEETDDLEKS